MKKTVIYTLSISIGLILGFLSYSLINKTFDKDKNIKINYGQYIDITKNLNNLKYIKYGDIDVKNNNDFVLINSFLNITRIDLDSKTFSFETRYLTKNIETLFGDIEYKLTDFDYSYNFYEGKCILDEVKNEYNCITNNNFQKNKSKFKYDVIKAYYDELGNIIIKSKYYYELPFCDGLEDNYCLYKDENGNHLIGKARYKEIKDYSIHFDLITFIYNKSEDNRFYLTNINW